MTQRRWIRNSQLLALVMKYFARAHIWVYQRTNGRLGAKLLWFPAALMTTTGRKSRTAAHHTDPVSARRRPGGTARVIRRTRTTIRCGTAICEANPKVHIQIRG